MSSAQDECGPAGWVADTAGPDPSAVLGALPWIALAVSPSLVVIGANASWRSAVEAAGPSWARIAEPVGAWLADLMAPGEAERWLPRLADLLAGHEQRLMDSVRFAWQQEPVCCLGTAVRLDSPVGGAVLCCVDVGPDSDLARLRDQHEAPRYDLLRKIANRLTHRINNPLFVITATLEDLLAETDDDQQRARLQGALDAAWKVGESVRGLVELRNILTDPHLQSASLEDLERILREP